MCCTWHHFLLHSQPPVQVHLHGVLPMNERRGSSQRRRHREQGHCQSRWMETRPFSAHASDTSDVSFRVCGCFQHLPNIRLLSCTSYAVSRLGDFPVARLEQAGVTNSVCNCRIVPLFSKMPEGHNQLQFGHWRMSGELASSSPSVRASC